MAHPLRSSLILLLATLLAACYGDVPWPDGPAVDDDAEPAGPPPFQEEAWPEDAARAPVIVTTSLKLTREEPPGVSRGFDVDGLVSSGDDPGGCYWQDLTSPDGQDGIDNQLATLVPALEVAGGGVVEDFIQTAINDGSVLLMLLLDDVDSPIDDPHVVVTMTSGMGKPLVGTSGVLLPSQTFALDPDAPVGTSDGSIVNGRVVAGPFDSFLPIVVFGVYYELDIRDGWMQFDLLEDGSIVNGLFGGGVTVESLVALIDKTGDKDVIGLFGPLIPNAADLAPDADGVCHQVSVAVEITGVPAFLYDDELDD